MEKTEIHVDPAEIEEQLTSLLEKACAHFGVQVRMRGTQRTYPGSQHWHLHMPGQRGILEITMWPEGKRVWFSVQSGRRAKWIADILPQLKIWIEGQIPRQF